MTVYLLHLNEPLGNERHQARHYIGCTTNVRRRMNEHRVGHRSASILNACRARGITWKLARTWEGGRDTEVRLKSWHKSKQLCPICRGEHE